MQKRLIRFRGTDDYARITMRPKGAPSDGKNGIKWVSCGKDDVFKKKLPVYGMPGGGHGKLGAFEWFLVIPGLGVLFALGAPAAGAGLSITALISMLTTSVLTLIATAAGFLGISVASYLAQFGKILPFTNGTKPPKFTKFDQSCAVFPDDPRYPQIPNK
jgi:hypothetical protein